MKRALVTLATAAALLLVACSDEAGRAVSGDDDLIGGTTAKSGELPATVGISRAGKNHCTAARVGERQLLTAAHCVLNLSTLSPRYDAEHPVTVMLPSGATAAHVVKATHVHPKWIERCAETLCSVAAVTAKLDAPDVAVLELTAPIEGATVAPVEREALAPGDGVTIVGFGCTKGVHVADDRAVKELLSAEQEVATPASALHDGSYVEATDEPVFSGNYVLTRGRAGLCPGDSGGPLYVRRGATLAVAGVNANYTLLPDDVDGAGVPVTNWHTRLDVGSRNGVAAWLTEIGVR
ncbi:MAG: S1 family peptidase [Labilithrix sp.]|nr:S1 family peptidase [Labilithrix sp.]MCW5813946.1 S1 family peptidase [Labilithrix sp.]